MRTKYRPYRSSAINNIEKSVIRVIIVCTVILTVFQLKSITNPVDFYLKIAGDIDSPAFKYSQYAEKDKKINLYFRSEPEGPVMVKQNDRTLGIIGKGEEIEVEPGKVYLDATAVAFPVTVLIVYNEKSYRLELNCDVKSFDIQLKSNGTL